MDHFLKQVDKYTGFQLPLEKEHYVYLLGFAVFLELAGGILFIFNSDLGALMLLAFTVTVSPIMHNFWDVKDENAKQVDMIQFFKNVAIIGALLAYLGAKPRKLHQA
ncbi:hypothetical protein WJX72_007864 [[Myrmecia] bisecta]|uniref:DoxX family protein n=1 Tax=[Myrmecia] bisecta TaxID=41462 RepID=A0AAW1PDD1_9CHLO